MSSTTPAAPPAEQTAAAASPPPTESKTQPASTDSAAAAPTVNSKEDEAKIEELQQEIHALEDAITEKRRVLEEKKKNLGVTEVKFAEAEKAANDAEKRLIAAQEAFRAVEQQKANLAPQYERCQQNKDQHAKAESLRKDIADAEKNLRKADAVMRDLEERLQTVSAQYKSEREQRAMLVSKFGGAIDQIRQSVEEKVALTTPVDATHGVHHGQQLVLGLSKISLERDISLMQCSRHVHELNAVVQMKKQRAVELKADCEREIDALRSVREERVKTMMDNFEDQRMSLLRDIFDLHEQNRQQQEELKNRKLVSDHSSAFEPGNSNFKRQAATRADDALQHKIGDLEEEKAEILKKLEQASTERTKYMNKIRELGRSIDIEKAQHDAHLRSLEAKLQREKQRTLELERENRHLEESCDVLAQTIIQRAPQIEDA